MIVVPHLQHKPIDVSEKKNQQKTTAANILSLNYQAEKADEQKREGGMCGIVNRRANTLKNFKAFVRLKKRNRLNYYFLFIPFWELYLKL